MLQQGVCGGVAAKDEKEENMAAWLLGIKNVKIQPYVLPPLGNLSSCPFPE